MSENQPEWDFEPDDSQAKPIVVYSSTRKILRLGFFIVLLGINGLLVLALAGPKLAQDPPASVPHLIGYIAASWLAFPILAAVLLSLRAKTRNIWTILKGCSYALLISILSNCGQVAGLNQDSESTENPASAGER